MMTPQSSPERFTISATPSAGVGALLLAIVFGFIGRRLFRLSPGEAVAGGVLAAALHFLSELWHQKGHARAAARAGYPMTGVRLWGVLGTSLYPPDEPALPDEVHVARALGGPRASAWLAGGGALAAVLAWPVGGVARMVSTLFALENLLVFTLGAFLPMPFMETDGATILHHRQTAGGSRRIVIQE
ncbi:MAG TPA: hypothetical protein PLH39_03905 [Promineifilum sp.]|nr:hypothetical protein [Promineifilum sp.]